MSEYELPENVEYGFCVQGKGVFETRPMLPAKNVTGRSMLVQAHVCDGCRSDGGEINLIMIDEEGNGRLIVYPPELAAALAHQILVAVSHLPNQKLELPSAGKPN